MNFFNAIMRSSIYKSISNVINDDVLSLIGEPNGIAPLGPDRRISPEYMPITSSIWYPVQTQAEMLALSEANIGDYAYIIADNLLYVLLREPASNIDNWYMVSQPFAVTAFNGRPGPVITPQANDYTTDLVPEGDNPLRRYYARTRFDADFDDRFPVDFNDAFNAHFPSAFEGALAEPYRKLILGMGRLPYAPELDHGQVQLVADPFGDIPTILPSSPNIKAAIVTREYQNYFALQDTGVSFDWVNASDFSLRNTGYSLKNLCDSIGQPNGIAPLNELGKVDPSYLPVQPDSYTDDNARAALAAANYDKILGIKNTAVASANMLDNTLNIYVDSSRNEYLQHKIAGTVNNRRIAMHGTAVTFSSVATAGDITPTTTNVSNLGSASYQLNNIYSQYGSINSSNRRARFQVNMTPVSAYLKFYDTAPALISSEGPNWVNNAIAPMQDVLAFAVPGASTYSNYARIKLGTYRQIPSSVLMQTAMAFHLTNNVPSEGDDTPEILRLCAEGSTVMKVLTSAPNDECFFKNSMAFYTDPSQKYYAAKIKKNDSSTAILSALPISTADAPPAKDGPAAALKFYTMSNYLYVQINSVDGSAPAKFCPIGVLQDAV